MTASESSSEQDRPFSPYAEHPAVVTRTQYPQERQYSWLPILLDAYAIDDYERKADVLRAATKKDLNVACHRGCANCCRVHAIPVMALEFMGISWYLLEICDQDLRKQIGPRLLNCARSAECPFLLSSVCAIYPVRPLACRDFFVLGEPCGADEDLLSTRPHSIHPPNLEVSRRVAYRIFDYEGFGCATDADKERAFSNGDIVTGSRPMHELDWATYIQKNKSLFE